MGAVAAYETAAGRRYRVRYRKPDRSQTDKRGFRTKREAELFLASVQVSMARGEFVDATAARETIGVLGIAWLRVQTHLKPSSIRPVEIAWRLHVEPRWGTTPVSAVRYSDVQEWVAQLSARRSATTVIRAHGVLASILDVAARDQRISSNPARGVKMPRKDKKAHAYLTHEQVSTLALECGEKRTFVLVLAYCGLRWGEAVGLRVQDVDLGTRRLNVTVNAVEVGDKIEVGTPKTHKRRSVPFPALLGPALAQQCAGRSGEDIVFVAEDGGYMRRTRTDESSRGWFSQAVRRAGIPRMTPHDLRHTAASLAIQSGANVKAVQRMLGHASAAMTLDVYADLFDDDLDLVATRLNEGLSRTSVGKMWANGASEKKLNPLDPRNGGRRGGSASAVAVGFEPTDGLHHHMFSRHAPSAARTRHREEVYGTSERCDSRSLA
jgi:integrase